MSYRMFPTWLLRHGIIRFGMRMAGRLGDSHAKLSSDGFAREDPYPLYNEARVKGSIVRGQLSVITTTHETTSAVLRGENFKSGFDLPGVPWLLRKSLSRGKGKLVGPIDYPSLLVINPPEHTKYRRQVAKVFTARAIAKLDDHIRTTCHELLDEIESWSPDGMVDLVDTYAGLLPVTVICDILGIPNDMRHKFLEWGTSGAMSLDIGLSFEEYLDCENGVRELNDWMYQHIAHLRAHPGDDLLSKLIQVEDEGLRMTDTQIMATVSLLLAAGFETTVNMISSGAYLVATHPAQRKELEADPSLWGNATEEILRYEAPVQETLRVCVEDTVVAGVKVKKGDFIGALIGAANRDPSMFPDPDRFDIHRQNAGQHLTFSAGVHFCIGSSLARAEGRLALQILFDRYPELAVTGTPQWRTTRTLRGFRHLPVTLGPKATHPQA